MIGDNEGLNPTLEHILTALEDEDIETLVDVGDLTSSGDAQELTAVLNRLSEQSYSAHVVVGNNDLGPSSQPDSTAFREIVRDPTYTSFNIRNAHIVLLDNANRRIGFSPEELTWLAADLTNNVQPVTLLFMHRPIEVPFENIIGNDETKASRQSNQQFLNIIQQHPVDRIFTGHLETFLEYDLHGTPVTVTGGAHNRPDQTGFGASLPAMPHFTLISVHQDTIDVEKVEVLVE